MANRGPRVKGLKKVGMTGYMKARIRQNKKNIKPPKLAGVGVKGYR